MLPELNQILKFPITHYSVRGEEGAMRVGVGASGDRGGNGGNRLQVLRVHNPRTSTGCHKVERRALLNVPCMQVTASSDKNVHNIQKMTGIASAPPHSLCQSKVQLGIA